VLNQKAVALSVIAKNNPSHQKLAIDFLEFRAKAIRNDFLGLVLLLEILIESNDVDRAWLSIEETLRPGLRSVANRAGISLHELHAGFRNAGRYDAFREQYKLLSHVVTLRQYGLAPAIGMLAIMDALLMAPFGVLIEEFRAAKNSNSIPNIRQMFERTLRSVTRLFCTMGSEWLAPFRPEKQEAQVEALTLGIMYLPDIVVAETARLIGYLSGLFQYSLDLTVEGEKQDWKDVIAEVGAGLMEQVFKDWNMRKDAPQKQDEPVS
jgi:hypothetical protein